MCFLFPSFSATEVSEENYIRLKPLLNTMNQSKYTRETSSSVNVLLSLQLVGIQNQNLKQTLIQQIKYTVKRRCKLLYSLEDLEKIYLFKDYLLLILKIMHPKYPCYIHSNGTKLEVTET